MGLNSMSGSWEGPEILKLTDSLHKDSRPYWCPVTLSPGSRNVGAPSGRTEVFGLSFKIPRVLLRKCSEMNLIIGIKATHRRDMLPPASSLAVTLRSALETGLLRTGGPSLSVRAEGGSRAGRNL